jgi:transposase
MEVVNAYCAGLDVHKDIIVACRRQALNKTARRETESFGTTTAELMRLSEWLADWEITHVVMESTGVYWKPVWNVLGGDFELILVNPQHVKAVPGRKSDVKDAEWLAELLAHGLVRASFIPEPPIQALRDLTRTHKQITRQRVSHVQRIQKHLHACNIRLDSVLSEIHGKSGLRIIRAIVDGETDPAKLASLVGKVKATREQLIAALDGRVTPTTRVLLRTHLDMIAAADQNLAAIEKAIDEALIPFSEAVALLETIPGVGHATACMIVAEIGVDMTRFPSPGHLVSWAGLCPEMNESAGKRRSNKLKKGDPWLKTALCQAALAAQRCKRRGSLHDLYFRVRSRRGAKKAIMAVAASILTSVHAMLTNHAPYHELDHHHRAPKNKQRTVAHLTRRLSELGYQVELRPAA